MTGPICNRVVVDGHTYKNAFFGDPAREHASVTWDIKDPNRRHHRAVGGYGEFDGATPSVGPSVCGAGDVVRTRWRRGEQSTSHQEQRHDQGRRDEFASKE